MILCVGEILADLIANDNNGIISYEKRAGGAPFNVACTISKLGGKVSFVGNVGDDLIGRYLFEYAADKNLTKTLINIDQNHNTTLAFVDLDSKGERSFCFYRKNTADFHLSDIDDETIKSSNIIHIGSLMLSEKEGCLYAYSLIKKCKKHNKLISFDINFRSDIYPSFDAAIEKYKTIINEVDIIKISEDEIDIFGEEYINSLKNKHIFITLGSQGSKYKYNNFEICSPTIKISPIDTTGAGDAFFGAILYQLDNMKNIQKEITPAVLKFANITGGLNTLTKGAIDGLPTLEKVKELM